jgi:hypothetical protein
MATVNEHRIKIRNCLRYFFKAPKYEYRDATTNLPNNCEMELLFILWVLKTPLSLTNVTTPQQYRRMIEKKVCGSQDIESFYLNQNPKDHKSEKQLEAEIKYKIANPRIDDRSLNCVIQSDVPSWLNIQTYFENQGISTDVLINTEQDTGLKYFVQSVEGQKLVMLTLVQLHPT